MKINSCVLCILSVMSFSVSALDFKPGGRIGLGVSQSHLQTDIYESNRGYGVKLEYGYDLTPIIGLYGSFEKNEKSGAMPALDIEGMTFKFLGEAGYTFSLGQDLNIKPYFTVGANTYREEKLEFNNAHLGLGVGVRLVHRSGVYINAAWDYSPGVIGKNDLMQTAFTMGYKF